MSFPTDKSLYVSGRCPSASIETCIRIARALSGLSPVLAFQASLPDFCEVEGASVFVVRDGEWVEGFGGDARFIYKMCRSIARGAR